MPSPESERDAQPGLRAGEVHLWSAPLDVDRETLSTLGQALTPAECHEARRLRFALDRVRAIAARGWLRRLLATYLDQPAADLRLERSAGGKPHLAAPAHWLRFSVSHSAGLAAYAVSGDRELGVDIERVPGDPDEEPVPPSHLTAGERAVLSRLPRGERGRMSLQFWTGKEAYLKAIGTGLSVAPARVDAAALFDRAARREPGGAVRAWSLHAFDASPGYVGAIALPGADARVPSVASPLSLSSVGVGSGPRAKA